jgi:Zn ribbon nucleic-acid-binding protein
MKLETCPLCGSFDTEQLNLSPGRVLVCVACGEAHRWTRKKWRHHPEGTMGFLTCDERRSILAGAKQATGQLQS